MTSGSRLLDQPRAVWAVAFACVVAFMGIGLVDPILPTLADELNATPSGVSLLFTSYFAMTGVSMLVETSAGVPRGAILVAVDASPSARAVVETAERAPPARSWT